MMRNQPRLVAVSKTVSIADMLYAYDAGQRVFGENYVNELISKASQMPKDVRWHFIGHLQSNKSKKLLLVENLDTIETIDSEKLADQLHMLLPQNRFLNVFIQVNVSREESKWCLEMSKKDQSKHMHILPRQAWCISPRSCSTSKTYSGKMSFSFVAWIDDYWIYFGCQFSKEPRIRGIDLV